MPPKPSVLDLPEDELAAVLARQGQPPYRARQVMRWVYRDGAGDFAQMSDLPAALRAALAETLRIHVLDLVRSDDSRLDATKKIALRTHDGHIIETVLMPQPGRRDRFSVCLSSQAGCAFGCVFCASGARGLQRNLDCAEIVDQFLWARAHAGEGRVSNIVFMGMGEPLANYDSVVRAIRTFTGPAGVGRRSIAVSTCGLPAQIRRLAGDNLGVHLAVSLHAPNDALRRQLMPSAGRHPVREVVEAARYYAATTGRKVSFEYLLAAGVNDQPEGAPRLARLLRDMQCMVNVIPFNPHRFCAQLEPPSAKQVAVFVAALRRAGLEAASRRSLGGDVSAACGQLSGRLSHGSSPRGG